MKVLITNAVPLNGGDEALLRAVLEALAIRSPDAEAMVLCKDLARCRELLPDLRLGSDIEFVQSTDELDVARRAYWDADVVVSAPGGFLHDHYEIEDRLRGIEVALSLGTPVVLFAQSVGPFWRPSSLRRVPEVLNQVHRICTRDAASRDHLIACGVDEARITQTADAAFLWRDLAPALFRLGSGPVRTVALAFRAWPPGGDVAPVLAKAGDLCRDLLRDDERRLVFLSTCQGVPGYHDDSRLAREIVRALPPPLQARCEIDERRYGPRALIGAYGAVDAYIGMRLHGAILSMLAGKPAMGLGYEPKTAEIFSQLGLAAYQVQHDADSAAWIETAGRFLLDVDLIRARLRATLDERAGRARESFAALDTALTSGQERATRKTASVIQRTNGVGSDTVPVAHLGEIAAVVNRIGPKTMVVLGSAAEQLRRLCPDVECAGCDLVRPSRPVDFPWYQRDLNRQALTADLHELELVVCAGLLEHVDDLPRFLVQLRQRLRTGGHLVASYATVNRVGRRAKLLRGHSSRTSGGGRGSYSPQELRRLVADAGFDLLDGPGALRRRSSPMTGRFVFVASARADDGPLAEIERLVPPHDTILLVDDQTLSPADLVGRSAVRFFSGDGHDGWAPADGAEAVAELERRRAGGASFIVFTDAGLWWLSHYPELTRHLSATARRVVERDDLVVYDLRTP